MEGKNYRNISKIAHISFVYIGKRIRKFNGEESQFQNKNPSITPKAFQMFKDGMNRVVVAIALNLEAYDAIGLFHDCLRLSNLDDLVTTYDYLGRDFPIFLDLLYKMKDQVFVTPLLHKLGVTHH